MVGMVSGLELPISFRLLKLKVSNDGNIEFEVANVQSYEREELQLYKDKYIN